MSAEDDVDGIIDVTLDPQKAREIEENLDHDAAQDLAIRKLFHAIGTEPEEDVGIVEASYRTAAVIDDLARRVARLENEFDRVDRAAETALTIAETEAKPGDGVSKKQVAKLKSRNELVRRLARGGVSKGAQVTVPEVQEMAKPEVVVHYQTVKDAWSELAADWDAFVESSNQEDDRVLLAKRDRLEPALVKAVERGLDRDDLAKRLISDGPGEGG